MEQHTELSEVTIHHEPSNSTKRIWKTFWILLIITVIELALGYSIHIFEDSWSTAIVLFVKGVIVILTLVKAFYIVSIFMHLGDELRNMIMTVVVPLTLFIWFIGAFLWDGSMFRASRNRYNPTMEVRKNPSAPVEKPDNGILPRH